jgi:hypothetical protein
VTEERWLVKTKKVLLLSRRYEQKKFTRSNSKVVVNRDEVDV